MANFPALKTGALAQYPLSREVRFSTEAVRFIDGSRQTFRLYGRPLRRWTVSLTLLDEQEMANLILFIETAGRGLFTFTDPVTGEIVPNCLISGEQFDAVMEGELNSRTTIEIEETA